MPGPHRAIARGDIAPIGSCSIYSDTSARISSTGSARAALDRSFTGNRWAGNISIRLRSNYTPTVYQGALIECGNIDGVGLVDWALRSVYRGRRIFLSGLPLLDTPRPEFDRLVNGPWLELMGEPGHYRKQPSAAGASTGVIKHLSEAAMCRCRLEGLLRTLCKEPSIRATRDRAYAREFARHARYPAHPLRNRPGAGGRCNNPQS